MTLSLSLYIYIYIYIYLYCFFILFVGAYGEHNYRIKDPPCAVRRKRVPVNVKLLPKTFPEYAETVTPDVAGTVTPYATGTVTADATGTVTPDATGTVTADATGTVTADATRRVTMEIPPTPLVSDNEGSLFGTPDRTWVRETEQNSVPKHTQLQYPEIIQELKNGMVVIRVVDFQKAFSYQEIATIKKKLGNGLVHVQVQSNDKILTVYDLGAKPLVKLEPTDTPVPTTAVATEVVAINHE